MYQNKMLAAHAGKADYPKIRTFLPVEASTNCVYDDMKEAEKWTGMDGKIDIRDLTWEQRERVLRLLFAKVNGLKSERYATQSTYVFRLHALSRAVVANVFDLEFL